MDGIKPVENTKEKILNAAREEFIEKGYEKAKMEDIAKRAGLTKVMLYYHFNSKENILREIFFKTMELAKSGFDEEFKSINDIDGFNFNIVKDKIENVLKPNIEIIKLIIIENVKGNLDETVILDPLRGFFDNIIGLIERSGVKIRDREEAYIKIFFFQTAPILFNLIFSKKFNYDFNIAPEKTDSVFSDKFAETITMTIKNLSLKSGSQKRINKKLRSQPPSKTGERGRKKNGRSKAG